MKPALPSSRSTRWETIARQTDGGSVLLEVLIALALFVAAAAVATGALQSSLQSFERQKLSLHSLNLASTALAEVELGIRQASGEGQQPFETPFQDWTCEFVRTAGETETQGSTGGASQIEVIVRHTPSAHVRRLTRLLRPPPVTEAFAPTSLGSP